MKFSDAWAGMTAEERDAMAKAIDTHAGYLNQLATRWRGKRPSLDFMVKIAEADPRFTVGDLATEFSEIPDEKQAA